MASEKLPVAGLLNALFIKKGLDIFPAPANGVLTLPASCSVSDAVATLGANNYLCAPVLDDTKSSEDGWSSRVLGVVDFLSLVSWMLAELEYSIPASFQALLKERHMFRETTLRDVVGKGRWAPFVPVDSRVNTALDVLILLGKYGLHRVVQVESPAGKITNIITQSSAVQVLTGLMDEPPFGDVVAHRSLNELGLGSPTSVVCVRDTDPLFVAFKEIGSKIISAVPVVDAEGFLVGTISSKDLRSIALNPELFAFLRLPISTYPQLRKTGGTCILEETLSVVLQRFHLEKVHRLWVVKRNDQGREQVTGVVSLGDVLSVFVTEPRRDYFAHYFA